MKVFGPVQVKVLKVSGFILVALALSRAYIPNFIAKLNHQPCSHWVVNGAQWLPDDELWACETHPDVCEANCASLSKTVPQICQALEKSKGTDL